jgi:hypothetical protein
MCALAHVVVVSFQVTGHYVGAFTPYVVQDVMNEFKKHRSFGEVRVGMGVKADGVMGTEATLVSVCR